MVSRTTNGKRCFVWTIAHQKGGFSYIYVLMIIVAMGIAASSASRYWSTMMQRETEQELLFRGDQIRSAIISYYHSTPEGTKPSFPNGIEDLIKDNRYPFVKRHLRKHYMAPLTSDGQWGLIIDSAKKLRGVFSTSEKPPLKTGNFKTVYKNFEKAKAYSDWKFIFQPSSSD